MPLLNVENLETTFFMKSGAVKAVDGVSYSIAERETLGLVGESGCGKSVISYSVMRLLDHPGRVTNGKVFFEGRDLLVLTEEEMRRVRGRRIAMIFQEPMTALNPVLSIGTQITEQIMTHDEMTKADARAEAIDLLKTVGIPTPERRIDNYPHQLSGGMRQRAMIAMALSCKPDILIADEPTTALDVTIQAQILDLLVELQGRFGMAIQFITHDLGVISEVADRIVVIYAGRVMEEAQADAIFTSPRHPYTVGLMNSIPRMDKTEKRLPAIEGVVPSPADLPKGCRFNNRCPRATDECRNIEPGLEELAPDHAAACFHPY